MALPTPTITTIRTSTTCDGDGFVTTHARASGEDQLFEGEDDQEPLAVDLVGDEAAHHGEQQRRAELGEDDDADEGARVR